MYGKILLSEDAHEGGGGKETKPGAGGRAKGSSAEADGDKRPEEGLEAEIDAIVDEVSSSLGQALKAAIRQRITQNKNFRQRIADRLAARQGS